MTACALNGKPSVAFYTLLVEPFEMHCPKYLTIRIKRRTRA
jgi:hypothetical protein